MAENIVINFELNTQQLKDAADELVKMGQITEKEAEAFKKINFEAANVKKTVKELTDVANKAASEVLNTQAKLTDGTKKQEVAVKSLRAQYKEAVAEVIRLSDATGGKLTPELLKASKAAAGIKDRMADLNDTLDALNPDAKLTAFVKIGVGVTGAFAAAQGAMALFGNESEEVQKVLLKVQSAMALTQGLNSVLQLGDAFKNLRTLVAASAVATEALAVANTEVAVAEGAAAAGASTFAAALTATGIGAIVVGLGLLIVALYKLNAANNEAAASTEALKKKQENAVANQILFAKTFDEALDKTLRQRKREIDILSATEGKEKEVFKAKMKFIEDELNARRKAIKSGYLTPEDLDKELEINKDLSTQLTILQINYSEFLKKERIKRVEGAEEIGRKEIKLLAKNDDIILEGRKVTADDWLKKWRENQDKLENEVIAKEQEVFRAAFDFYKQLNQQRSDEELAILEDKHKKGLVSEQEFERQSAAIKRKAAQQAKDTAIFEAIINTATAVTQVLGKGPAMIALVAALGAIEIAAISARPLPKYKHGTLSVPGIQTGQDSVHAMLMPGEAVIPTATNKAYATAIDAMYHGKISPHEMNAFVKSRTSATSGYSPYDFKYAMSGLRMNLGNADYLAMKIGEQVNRSAHENKVLTKRQR